MLKIITDSATDLPKDYIQAHHLHVIPTPVVIDEVDYFDGATIQTKEFYDILDDMNRDVRTYHINPEMFENAFTPYAEAGDNVIYLCFSTGIAGTFNAANIARNNVLENYPDFDLTIIDSKCASIGFGLLGFQACYHAGKGCFQGRNHRSRRLFYRSYPSRIYGPYFKLPDQGRQIIQVLRSNRRNTGYQANPDRGQKRCPDCDPEGTWAEKVL